jgi:hypothetical protein
MSTARAYFCPACASSLRAVTLSSGTFSWVCEACTGVLASPAALRREASAKSFANIWGALKAQSYAAVRAADEDPQFSDKAWSFAAPRHRGKQQGRRGATVSVTGRVEGGPSQLKSNALGGRRYEKRPVGARCASLELYEATPKDSDTNWHRGSSFHLGVVARERRSPRCSYGLRVCLW